jgi:hypothetical protein
MTKNMTSKNEQDRCATIRARLNKEDEDKHEAAKDNLAAAQAAFEVATEEEKVLAERVLFRAIVCEQEMRERKTGPTPDMKCACGYVKGRGRICCYCDRHKKALYGGQQWVNTGSYNGFMC